jgi:regulator of nucleoside diphosphate kinase
METNTTTEIYLTQRDAERVATAIAASSSHGASTTLLCEEIARARIVPQSAIPPDVVTMNSRIKIVDANSGAISELTLVYPRDANADLGRVSVLAPLGSALLGLRVGQTMEWPLPSGRVKRVTVLEVCYQPEAAGDYDR